ncbi:MAG: hypothetical protein WA126_04020 [Thermodesulfovibrionales bacterium]
MHQLPPIDDDKQFEKLIRDICRYVFKEPTFELYGKRGEGQDGIDGWHVIDSKIVAFQCKKKDLTAYSDDKLFDIIKTEMRTEALKAKEFFSDKQPVTKYIFAATYKNTKHLQNCAAALTVETGMPIEYWGWQTIEEQVQEYHDILEKYFAQFLIDLGHSANKYVRHITKEEIGKAKITESQAEFNSGDTLLIFSSSFNIKLNMTPQNSKAASEFSKVSPEYLAEYLVSQEYLESPRNTSCFVSVFFSLEVSNKWRLHLRYFNAHSEIPKAKPLITCPVSV